MVKKFKNTKKVILTIFLASISLSIFIANLVHTKLPAKWVVDYKLFENVKINKSFDMIDKLLEQQNIKSNDYDEEFKKQILDIIMSAPALIMRDNKEYFVNMNNIKITSTFIKFETHTLDKVEENIIKIIDETNKIVKKNIVLIYEYYIAQLAQKRDHEYSHNLRLFKSNIKDIELVNDDYIFKDKFNKTLFLKSLIYRTIADQLGISNLKKRAEQEAQFNLLINNNNNPIISDKYDNVNTEDLISALKIIYDMKVDKREESLKDYLENDTLLINLRSYRDQLLNEPYLSRLESSSKFYDFKNKKFEQGNFLNKKPTKFYMILSFLFIGLVIATFCTFLYLNLTILKNKIMKKLTTLLRLM